MYGAVYNKWVDYDVTSLVQYWSNNPTLNFGMKISQDDAGYRSTTGYHWGAYNFPSSDYTGDLTLRPVLTVKFIPSLDAKRWHLYR
jgi:hypothetical protein